MYSNEISEYINKYLETLDKSKLKNALEYSLIGGKCIRGFIVKHIIETLNSKNIHWAPIVSVELIHAASLIIDDLPCMDNDSIRRGKPSAFKMFGQHESILTAFYMISESLKILNSSVNEIDINKNKNITSILINYWCELLGKNLVVGQMMDLKSDYEELLNVKITNKNTFNENLITFKTSSLFSFCFIIGAMYSDSNMVYDINDFSQMGNNFGMMFQLMDDNKDKEKDSKFNNYILSKGKEDATLKYNNHKINLIQLLNKYNLYTNKFKILIQKIDSDFFNEVSLLTT